MAWTWNAPLALLFVACSGDGSPTDQASGDTGAVTNDPDRDQDGFAQSVDCNDNNAQVNPDAPELCDGFDNDCDALTVESGVAFQPMNGGPLVDRTAEFAAGTAAKPASVELADSGLLHVCDGVWYASVQVTATGPTGIEGHRSDPKSELALDGGGMVSGITITTADNFRLANIQMQNFVAGASGLGGALLCDQSGASLQLERVFFDANTASVAGGSVAIVDGCSGRMADVAFTGGSAPIGGHLAIDDTPENSPVEVERGMFSNGTAVLGGSVAVASEITPFGDSDSVLRCRECEFSENQATDPAAKKAKKLSTASGGAIWVGGNGQVQTQRGSFDDNTADAAGGAVVLQSSDYDDATAEFSDTDFSGNRAAGERNDVRAAKEAKGDYEFGSGTSAQCDEADGCTEA